MYYRYKSKSGNKKIYKRIFLVLFIVAAVFLGNEYKQYIFFWRFTSNSLEQKLGSCAKISDVKEREECLQSLVKIFDNFRKDNQLSGNAFMMSGKVHFLLGEALTGKSFSEILIYDGIPVKINDKANLEMLESIKCIKKCIALSGGDDVELINRIMLARASFYTGYSGSEEIFKNLKGLSSFVGLTNDDIRFYAIINILNGKEEHGLNILHENGKVNDTIVGRLFLAQAYSIAKRFTNSIMEYQSILKNTGDSSILKLVYINLGKLYFNQSLYNESLANFTYALKIDEHDNQLKIWIGKDYSALGNKIKARAIWSEVLSADNTNEEVKKLLNPM